HRIVLVTLLLTLSLFFFFNDTATPQLSPLSLHDALPISIVPAIRAILDSPDMRLDAFIGPGHVSTVIGARPYGFIARDYGKPVRSEEHTSELQSLAYLVCRLLLEKKKKKK